MFRPRHAYRSPITSRYRGKTKGCPVFNNTTSINASMVEQHDECLECLAKIKNRSDLYKTLADNKKPRNNVIKSLQRLSSSASNNRLKTCLQFLIIKVNEKSNPPTKIQQQQASATTIISSETKDTQLTSSKTQDSNGFIGSDHHQIKSLDDQIDGYDSYQHHTVETSKSQTNKRLKLSHLNQIELRQKHHPEHNSATQHLASPPQDQVSSTQDQVVPLEEPDQSLKHPIHDQDQEDLDSDENNTMNHNHNQNHKQPHESLSTEIEEPDSLPSPLLESMSPTSSISSSSSLSPSDGWSSSSSSSSSCSSIASQSPPPSSDTTNGLRSPRLKLSEGKIRKIKKRPILLDDYFTEHSIASTPTTSSACSPGIQQLQQHSTSLTMNSKINNVHMFQAPPKFINTLKPCKLPVEPTPTDAQSTPAKETMLNCAICGIKDRPPSISKIYGQNSCLLCTRFFAAFLKRPQQLYCAQDGDCLMTFDSRCQACWIKICLQKFNIEDHRKIGHKYSPRLLSSPYVTLITIDTSET